MKQQSMNQNANHVLNFVLIGKFQIPRNFSSFDFVIKPGNDGFSNFKQSPSNDNWGDETYSFDWTRHFAQIF